MADSNKYCFSRDQRRTLKAVLGKRWDPETRVLDKEITIDDVIDRLEGVMAGVRRGDYRRGSVDPRIAQFIRVWRNVEAFLAQCRQLKELYDSFDEQTRRAIEFTWAKSADENTFAGRLNAFGESSVPKVPTRRRGAPVDIERALTAQAVGCVLVTSGIRLTKSRDGQFARTLALVLEAANLRVPEDMFRLIDKAVPIVEREAFGFSRKGIASSTATPRE